MTPLKIKITVKDKALEMQVLEQDERLRGVGDIYDNCDLYLVSVEHPQMTRNELLIRGDRIGNDDEVARRCFDSNTARDAYLTRVKKLMHDFRVAWKAGEVEVLR